MQIDLATAKQAAAPRNDSGSSLAGASHPPRPASRGQVTPPPASSGPMRPMTLNIPSHLAFRAWPKFQPVIQIPAPPAHRVLARRWRMHGGRAAIVLSSSALAVTLLIGLTLIWPLFGAPVSAAPTAAAVLPAIKPPTASPTFTRPPATLTRPNATATPAISATPDLPATLQAAVAATLTAQPTPVAPTTAAQPAPAATAAASPLPSPTSFVNQGPLTGASGLLFDETFKPGGYWDVGETPYAVREISDGRFSITMKTVGAISWSLNGVSGDDFYVQAATSSDGCRAGDYYGLVFRARDDSNFYLFGISCDGRYRVLCQKDGEFAPLIDFKFSPAVAVNGGYNLLGVRAVKDQFSFYVNDDFLASTNDATFAQGRFGVFAKSFETGNLTIRFDDITAWSIKP